jgi:hypothetical protein
MEKLIPSQGEGEQFIKFGGPCPAAPHPLLCCTFENDLALLGGVFVESATAMSNGCCLDSPFESETDTPKLKLPAAVGVPEMFPVFVSNWIPPGSCPDLSEKEYGAVPPLTPRVAPYATPTEAEAGTGTIVRLELE